MHSLFLVHFVNLYMFRAYLGPASGITCTTALYKNWYLLFFLDDCCPRWVGIQSKQIRPKLAQVDKIY